MNYHKCRPIRPFLSIVWLRVCFIFQQRFPSFIVINLVLVCEELNWMIWAHLKRKDKINGVRVIAFFRLCTFTFYYAAADRCCALIRGASADTFWNLAFWLQPRQIQQQRHPLKIWLLQSPNVILVQFLLPVGKTKVNEANTSPPLNVKPDSRQAVWWS